MTTQRSLWIQLLAVEGLFFLSLGFGLHFFGAAGEGASRSTLFWREAFVWGGGALLGLGLLSLFLERRARILSFQKKRLQRSRAVSVDDSFRAFRAFGDQSPIFSENSIQSEVFSLDSPRVIGAKDSRLHSQLKGEKKVIVEHWEGPDLWVKSPRQTLKLSARQVVKLDLGPDENLILEPENYKTLKYHERSQGLLHVLAPEK